MNILGERLRRLRKEQGLSQSQLAGDQFTRSHVSGLETGTISPTPAALSYLGEVLGVDLGTDVALDEREQLIAAWLVLDEAAFLQLDGPAARFGAAEAALSRGDLHDALEGFSQVEQMLADEPLHLRAPAISRRAVCLARSDEPEYAAYLCQSTLDSLMAQGLSDPRAVLWLACAAHEAGRLLPFAEMDLPRDNTQAEMYQRLGATLRASGQSSRAAEAYDRALDLLTLSRLCDGLARCYITLAETSEIRTAIEYATRASSLSIDDDYIRCRLADLHRRAGHLAEAEELVRSAPTEPGLAARTMALITADQGEDPSAWFEEAAAAYAGQPQELAETLRRHGIYLAAQGDLAAAAQLLDRACTTLLIGGELDALSRR